MGDLIQNLFLNFAFETGIFDIAIENVTFLQQFLGVAAVLTCFLGFYVYRGEFSILMFIAVALLCCWGMGGKTDWGTITTTFAVVGIAASFFTYRWHLVGGIVVMGLMAGSLVWVYVAHSMIFVVIAAIVAAIMVVLFPVLTIVFITSLWGSMLIFENAYYMDFGSSAALMLSTACFVVGLLLQLFLTRNQKHFSKTCPDKVRYWAEHRGAVK